LWIAQGERVADPGERLDGTVRQLVHDRRVVPEPRGERPTGVEVVGRIGRLGNSPILGPHLIPKNVDIDGGCICHAVLFGGGACGSP
jgi:hypothetical protein